MTTAARFEADLPGLLAELVDSPAPDELEEVLTRTASTRQRTPWTLPEWWIPPTSAVDGLVYSLRHRWRVIALVALLVILAVGTVLVLGSTPPRVRPFGPAENGLVVFASEGDILTADPATGVVRPVVTGRGWDVEPRWSRDGTHFMFYRGDGSGSLMRSMYVARADGSDITMIVPKPMLELQDATFSPDGTRILFLAVGGRVTLAPADGLGPTQVLDLPPGATEAAFRPPDGSEISVLYGDQLIALAKADGSDLRRLVQGDASSSIGQPTWSPDGSKLAYIQWRPADVITARIHIVSPGTGERYELPMGPGSDWEGEPSWSNDGTRLAIARSYSPMNEDVVAAIVPVPDGGRGVETDPSLDVLGACCLSGPYEWAPDDSWILVTPIDSSEQNMQQTLIDPGTGEGHVAEWLTTSGPSWQRLP
jgi:WD40-like Beta Propeller Repeat